MLISVSVSSYNFLELLVKRRYLSVVRLTIAFPRFRSCNSRSAWSRRARSAVNPSCFEKLGPRCPRKHHKKRKLVRTNGPSSRSLPSRDAPDGRNGSLAANGITGDSVDLSITQPHPAPCPERCGTEKAPRILELPCFRAVRRSRLQPSG